MAMELNLVSQSGFPEKAIVSVRAGTVRRQAPYAQNKPLRFPQIGMQENPVKIDILRPVATAYLIVKPGESQYKVSFEGSESPMNCEVELKGVAEQGAEARQSVLDEKPTAEGAKEAKDYLETHKLVQFIQALLQTVIKERPENPYDYMARHFMSGYATPAHRTPREPQDGCPVQEAIKHAETGTINQSPRSSLPTARDGQLSGREEKEAPKEEAPKDEASKEEDMEKTKDEMRGLLEQALSSGKLDASLKAAKNKGAAEAPSDEAAAESKEEAPAETKEEAPAADATKEEKADDAPAEAPAADAPKEEEKADDAPAEAPAADAPKEEEKADDSPKDEAAKEEAAAETKEEAPAESKEEAPAESKEEAAAADAPKEEAKADEAPAGDAAKEEEKADDAPKEEAPAADSAKEEAPAADPPAAEG